MDFVKMQGCGNSFLIFDLRFGGDGQAIVRRCRQLCHHKLGAGGDGVVLLLPHESSFCAMEIYNADGSRASICGNALRCAGSLFFDLLPFFIHTDIGPVWLTNMGGKVWVQLPPARQVKPLGKKDVLVNVGNRHLVSFLPRLTGSEVQRRVKWAKGRDLNFMAVRPLGENVYKMRCFERGCGETAGCGSGACAAAEAAILTGRATGDEALRFSCRGGVLQVQKDDRGLWLAGDCQVCFYGKF